MTTAAVRRRAAIALVALAVLCRSSTALAASGEVQVTLYSKHPIAFDKVTIYTLDPKTGRPVLPPAVTPVLRGDSPQQVQFVLTLPSGFYWLVVRTQGARADMPLVVPTSSKRHVSALLEEKEEKPGDSFYTVIGGAVVGSLPSDGFIVFLDGKQHYTASTEQGHFFAQGLERGSYTLTVLGLNFFAKFQVEVRTNELTECNISLSEILAQQ